MAISLALTLWFLGFDQPMPFWADFMLVPKLFISPCMDSINVKSWAMVGSWGGLAS